MKQCILCGADGISFFVNGIGFVCRKCKHILNKVSVCPECHELVNKEDAIHSHVHGFSKDRMFYYHPDCLKI